MPKILSTVLYHTPCPWSGPACGTRTLSITTSIVYLLSVAIGKSWLHGHPACAVTQGVAQQSLCLLCCSAAPFSKPLIICEPGALHFHFALSPPNYVAGPAIGCATRHLPYGLWNLTNKTWVQFLSLIPLHMAWPQSQGQWANRRQT